MLTSGPKPKLIIIVVDFLLFLWLNYFLRVQPVLLMLPCVFWPRLKLCCWLLNAAVLL